MRQIRCSEELTADLKSLLKKMNLDTGLELLSSILKKVRLANLANL